MALDVHIIRLRGPWQVEPQQRCERRGDGRYEMRAEELPAAGRATMPADWGAALGGDYRGLVRYRRKFHQPSGLEPHERVFLVVEPPRSHGRVRLDGRVLGEVEHGGAAGRFEITPLLAETMTLEIDVAHPVLDERGAPTDDSENAAPGGLVGEVRLEIEE